jgi:alpha-galactosidase
MYRKFNWFFSVVSGLLLCSFRPSPGEAAVLQAASYKHYIDIFNAEDEELYPQYIRNAQSGSFLERNIPLLDVPDREMERSYYFRWWTSMTQEKDVEIVTVKLTHPQPASPPAFSLKWATPSHDAVGHWRPGAGFSKTVQPDWSDYRFESSMFARGAPVSTLFGSADNNVITVAVSDALNVLKTGAGVREEDGVIYHEIHFFTEPHAAVTEYTARVRIDRRPVAYWTALRDVSDWWAAQPGYAPAEVPAPARQPMYSTWYNYHQSLDPAVLLEELKVAKQMGFESIIIDDGWQTLDSSRGALYGQGR